VSPCHSLFTHVDTRADSGHRRQHIVANPDNSNCAGYRIFVLTSKIYVSIGLVVYFNVFQSGYVYPLPAQRSSRWRCDEMSVLVLASGKHFKCNFLFKCSPNIRIYFLSNGHLYRKNLLPSIHWNVCKNTGCLYSYTRAFQNEGADLKKNISNKPRKTETHSAHHWIEEGSKCRSSFSLEVRYIVVELCRSDKAGPPSGNEAVHHLARGWSNSNLLEVGGTTSFLACPGWNSCHSFHSKRERSVNFVWRNGTGHIYLRASFSFVFIPRKLWHCGD
jgi:hypothetical protein